MGNLKDEFACNKLGLNCGKLSDFYEPLSTCMPRQVLLITRGLTVIYMTVFMFISISQPDHSSEEEHNGWSALWLIFFTSWNYVLGLLFFIYAFGVSLKFAFSGPRTVSDDMEIQPNYNSVESGGNNNEHCNLPLYIKLFWIIYAQALALCTMVLIAYWGLIFDGTLKADWASFLSVDRHGINFLWIFIDFMLNRIPIRFWHFLYSAIVMVMYLIFNLAYTLIEDEAVYDLADWNNEPGRAVGAFFAMIALNMAMHIMWFFVNYLRRKYLNIPQ